MPKQKNRRSRSWAFTVQNPGKADGEYLRLFKALPGIKYIVFQREEAPSTDTEHLQGMATFKEKVSFSKLKLWSWREPSKNNAKLIAYCKKEETRKEGHITMEWGVSPAPGKRTDIEDGIKLMKANPNLTWSEYGMKNQAIPKYMAFFQKVYLETSAKRNHKCKGVWLFGESGSGKSYAARQGKYYEKGFNKWWDGYLGEARVVIDDLKGGVTITQLKKWCDEYPEKGETKGGHIQILCSELFVTSNEPPWSMYPNVSDVHMQALYRRFNVYEVVERNFYLTPPPPSTPIYNKYSL